jgi:hypothetical protein
MIRSKIGAVQKVVKNANKRTYFYDGIKRTCETLEPMR